MPKIVIWLEVDTPTSDNSFFLIFDTVLDVEPENYEALNRKAFTLAQLGEIDEAIYYNLSQKYS